MHILIIAEAGVNHNGNLETAKQLALTAKKSGADIVKFQTARPEALVSQYARLADYQKQNIGKEMSQLDMLKNLFLTYDEFIELATYCKEIGICFLSTPFDLESIEFLQQLGCDMWKIPSGEITNLPYLEKIALTHQKILLSTGMSTLDEIRTAMEILKQNGAGDVTLLHCTTQYPTPFEEVNLRAMLTLCSEFNVPVGYSDHTKGIEVPVAAAALGAVVIEKHFTLDRNMEGPDHRASLEPKELQAMIHSVRNIEKAMGSYEKKPTPSEISNKMVARKSIIATCNIKKGEMFTEENISIKRPGNGISPMNWYKILGTLAVRDFQEDELIEW